ncbi:hypothetical protein [Pendulispora albinea]|uniref:Uncharacterized protein n=1 Tax=Pendulispora albinea TaxID=2741071 RepID=A0ABZ2LMS6_9BACT
MNSKASFIGTLTCCACALTLGATATGCGMDASEGAPSGADSNDELQQGLALESAARCPPSAPPDGAVLWQHDFGITRSLTPSSVAVDRQGNVFHASAPTGVNKLDTNGVSLEPVLPGSLVAVDARGGTYIGSAPSGTEGAKVTKRNARGVIVWSRDLGANAPQSIAVTPERNVLVSGDKLGTVQLDADGDVAWTKPFGGYVASAANGEALITGWFLGTVDFGAGPVVSNQGDAFIVRLGDEGELRWSHILSDATLPINRPGGGGGVVTQPSAQIGKRIAEAPNGDVVVAGYASDSIKLFGEDLATPAPPDVGRLPLVYVARLDRRGAVLWKTHQYAFRDVRGLTVDVHGNVIVSGGTIGHAPPFVRTWIKKLDPKGGRLWEHEETFASGYGYADAVATDRCGNIFLALEAAVTPGHEDVLHGYLAKLRP